MKGSVHANIERYSMPSAGIYDVCAGLFFRGRYREIARTIASETPAGSAVLDVSCGPGEVLVQLGRLAPTLRTTGVDIDEGMIARARRKAARLPNSGPVGRPQFVVADVAAMPFADASFDLVVSSYAVHHWPDRHAGFAEVMRVLRPGGRAVIWDIASPHEPEPEPEAKADAERPGHSGFAAAHGGAAATGSPSRPHPSLLGTLRMMLAFRRLSPERYDFVKPLA